MCRIFVFKTPSKDAKEQKQRMRVAEMGVRVTRSIGEDGCGCGCDCVCSDDQVDNTATSSSFKL
jgi:hypothetical protein